jgi:hypothetical protein
MKEIKCDECGEFLFETEHENGGAIGAEAQAKGFVYKNACLFSDEYSSLYFCNHDCAKGFYQKHIPKNPEVTEKLNKLKADIPKMAREISNKMAVLSKKLKDAGVK